MKITDTTTTYTVEPTEATLVKNRDGDTYEVARVTVEISGDWIAKTTSGYKLTKAGKRSAAAPHPLMIWGDEVDALEAQALELVVQELPISKRPDLTTETA